jgi:ComEC/Rec2-related protein
VELLLLAAFFVVLCVCWQRVRMDGRWKLVLVLAAGLNWGYFHNYEILRHETEQVAVASDFFNALRTGVVIVSHDGKDYMARGLAEIGALGQTRCFAKDVFLFPCSFGPGLPTVSRPLSAAIESKVKIVSQPLRGWLLAILIGNFNQVPLFLSRAFFSVGLIHLVVISGMHITLIINCLSRSISLIVRFFYLLRWLGGARFVAMCEVAKVLGIAFVGYFLWNVGYAPSSQRAMLTSLISILASLLFTRTRWTKRMSLALLLQTLLFPAGFLHGSNFLSWASYSIVCELALLALRAKGWKQRLMAIMLAQIKLMFLALAVTGNISFISLVMNIVVVPLFPIIFFLGLISLVAEGRDWWVLQNWVHLSQNKFLEGIWFTSQKNDTLLGSVELRTPTLGFLFFGLCLLLLLKTVRNIKRMEEAKENLWRTK